jgi:hypothetical protein
MAKGSQVIVSKRHEVKILITSRGYVFDSSDQAMTEILVKYVNDKIISCIWSWFV